MVAQKSVLRCDGDKIVDGEGNRVILRGVSTTSYMILLHSPLEPS
jgi:hypothetical protein